MPSERGAVTGTLLRDLVVCERRAWHDLHSPDGDRGRVGPFVEMLWAEGVRHEAEVLERLDGVVADLRGLDPSQRRLATVAALREPGADHVLGAEIVHGGLLGRPDVVSRVDGRWVAGDVKSGSAHMPDGVRPREEYLAQIGLYASILGATRLGDGRRAFVIGSDGVRAMFDMGAEWSTGKTLRDVVDGLMVRAASVVDGTAVTRGAASAQCGLCHWRSLCKGELEAADDLTLVAEVGRAMRYTLEAVAPTRAALAYLDVEAVRRPDGGPGLPGLGAARLSRFRDRARLQLTPGARAYARAPLGLARSALEWHLDIESDPTRGGHVYLHGVWERRLASNGSETSGFLHFFADGRDGERDAFRKVWELLTSEPDAMVYYYSPFEKVSYRALQRRHPEVCSAEEVEAFFASARVVDLYTDVVRPMTEWPLGSYGIKPLAKSLGFSWAAEDASGASSIAWFDEYARTGDPALRDRIVDYNRSDCIASAVVLDGLIALPVGVPPWLPSADGGAEREPDDTVQPVDERREDLSPASPPFEPGAELPDGSYADGDAAWRAEGEDLRRFFDTPVVPEDARFGIKAPIDAGASSVSRTGGRRRAGGGGRVEPAATVYAAPVLRPVRAAIGGSGLDAGYEALGEDLPLAGGHVLRPTSGGGVALCDRLREALPWMEAPIALIERQLRIALWAGRPWLQWRPFCMVGPSGVGKSHLAREIGRLAGVGAAQLDLGGMHDSAALVSTSRGWSNPKPCWPAEMIAGMRVANPILTLDELDKGGGSDRNGVVKEALLGMLEPSTAAVFFDTCLMTSVDLSAVCWIATANDVARLPAPLRSRLDLVEVAAPRMEHFDAIAAGAVAIAAARWGVPPTSMPELPPRAMAVLRSAFARHRSVRRLGREVADVLAALVPIRRLGVH